MITAILLCYIGHLLDAPGWYFVLVIIKALANVCRWALGDILRCVVDMVKEVQKYEREV